MIFESCIELSDFPDDLYIMIAKFKSIYCLVNIKIFETFLIDLKSFNTLIEETVSDLYSQAAFCS